LLNRQGHHIGRRHTRTLMKKMGINALYCKPNLSQANQAHRKSKKSYVILVCTKV
jgi:putative transposase